MPPTSPMPSGPPGLANPNYLVQHSPVQGNFHRHHSTGSQHFVVNERGEIVGHASPIITHRILAHQGGAELGNNFPPRPQRANSYGGGPPGSSPFIQLQQGGQPLNFNINPVPFQMDASANNNANNISPPMDHLGPTGDGRMQQHQRHYTEPIPPAVFNPNPVGGNVHSRHPVSAGSDRFDQALAGENIEDIEVPEEVAVEEKTSSPGSSLSYASKLMMPPQDQTKGRTSSQAMTAGASHAKTEPSRLVYNVKFKRSQRNFVLSPRITRDVKIGCYVKVEADRGEDLGIVMGVIPVEKFLASNHRHRSMTEDSISSGDSPSQAANLGDMKRIMRAATNDEITLLEVKREEEEELLKICSTKVRQRGLPMTVVDAEYQFDRNKLTFFFQAEGRIDFRELVRDLFSMYKTRIWMQQLNKDGVVEEGDGNAFQ